MNNKTAIGIGSLLFAVVLLLILFFSSCNHKNSSGSFDYGTKSDSARYYYLSGFHEILDNGRWTQSEKAFRKAVEFDPDFVLGKSLVGRITRNLDEREQLLKDLNAIKHKVNNDERLLLDVYLSSVVAYNNRDKGIGNTVDFNNKRKQLAESNFRSFIKKYPEDDYVKAEYIEWLHSNHGPKVALDSLKHLATERQMNLGFYLGYSASLALELGDLEEAIALSKKLKEQMVDSTYTSYMKLKAEIYMAQNSLKKAKEYIDQIIKTDPNHLIAVGMQSKIEEEIKTVIEQEE